MKLSLSPVSTFVGLVGILAAAPVNAAPMVIPANQAEDCKLHVWSKPYVDNSIVGMFPGGIVGDVMAGNIRDGLARGKSTVTKDIISSDLLMDALNRSEILSKMKISPANILTEPSDDNYKPFLKDIVATDAGCHYGFRFNMVQFQQSTFHGKRLILYYVIIDRNISPKPTIKANYNIEKIKEFDPTKSDVEIEAVLKDGIVRILNDIAAKNIVIK